MVGAGGRGLPAHAPARAGRRRTGAGANARGVARGGAPSSRSRSPGSARCRPRRWPRSRRRSAPGRHLLLAAPTGVGKTAAALYPARETRPRHRPPRRVPHRQDAAAAARGRDAASDADRRLAVDSDPRQGQDVRQPGGGLPRGFLPPRPRLRRQAGAARRASGAALRSAAPRTRTASSRSPTRPRCARSRSRSSSCAKPAPSCATTTTSSTPAIALFGLAAEGALEDTILVVDEAHNLVDRAREYFSPRLGRSAVREARRIVEGHRQKVCRDLDELLGGLDELIAQRGVRRPRRPRRKRGASSSIPARSPSSGSRSTPSSPRTSRSSATPSSGSPRTPWSTSCCRWRASPTCCRTAGASSSRWPSAPPAPSPTSGCASSAWTPRASPARRSLDRPAASRCPRPSSRSSSTATSSASTRTAPTPSACPRRSRRRTA